MPTLQSVAEFISRLVTGDLTDDGVQWSTAVDTTTAVTDVDAISVTVEPGIEGTIKLIEFSLTAAFRSVTTDTADIIWKWQARNKDGTWVDLHEAVTEANINTTYVERTMSGFKAVVANLNTVPFDVRLIFQCDELNEGRAKVKNSSRIMYRFA